MKRVSLLALACAIATFAQEKTLPPHTPMLDVDYVGTVQPKTTDALKIELADVAGQAFAKAVKVTNRQAFQQFYQVQLSVTCEKAVQKTDVLHVRFYARGVAPEEETGEAKGHVYFQKNSPNWSKMLSSDFRAGPDWRRYDYPFIAGRNYKAGETALCFGLGYGKQEMEIGGVEFWRLPKGTKIQDLPRTPISYAGSAPDAPWRAEAAARIEKFRKGDLSVTVLDANGKPLPNATVKVAMKRHAFQFSSIISIPKFVSDDPKYAKYKEMARELFSATGNENALKWPPWDSNRGGYQKKRTIEILRQFHDDGYFVRGHVMVWPSWRHLPGSVQKLKDTPDQDKVPQLVLDHIREVGTATRDVVDEWDVINETRANHDLMDLFGRGIMIDWFKAAREVLPTQDLFINDYSILNTAPGSENHKVYMDTIRFLQDGGAPVTGVGFQSHLGGNLPNLEMVYRTLEEFAPLGLKMRVTEFDIDIQDEDAQARYTRDFMTVLFSHPGVVGFQMWGFWEGSHWRPNGAMYRLNWEPKPNAKAYRDLVFHQWWTDEQRTTDAKGACAVRGFLGQYEITVEAGGKARTVPVKLTKEGTSVAVRLQ
jgi:GH35 family endo-1,4-beta-xylanase